MRLLQVTPLLRIDHQSGSIRAAVARLLLFLVLWSQASFAAHQFEHDFDDVGETCAICLQFERGDDVIPESHNHSPIVVPAVIGYVGTPAVSYVRPAAPYLSRASP